MIKIFDVFKDVVIAKNETLVSSPIDLTNHMTESTGKVAFQHKTSSAGAADVDVTYKVSLDGVNFEAPTGSAAVFTQINPASGTVRDYVELDLEFAPWIQITAVEQNVAAVTEFDLLLCVV